MQIMDLFDRLWPLPRSLTGPALRETLNILNELVPITQHNYPTGMQCFDWQIPNEWTIRDAWVKNKRGEKLIDFKVNNLHVLGYSQPVSGLIPRAELLEHFYTLPDLPEAIPYLTSYYQERWGFCLPHERLAEFSDDEYDVLVDADLGPGNLTIGEGRIQGQTDREILLSSYVCHPSLANNELSGPIVQTYVYQYLLQRQQPLKYSYRFLYLPETIGSIVYLSQHGDELKAKLEAGYVVTCIGDDAPFTYKKSRRGDSLADRAALNVLAHSGHDYKVLDWFPGGSDERQYGSPGFNLPVGSIMRSMYGTYPEYHTSLDNREFISEQALQASIQLYIDVIETLEANDTYINLVPHCEPQLGKRGLYPTLGAQREKNQSMQKIRYLLAFSDGQHDVLAIADKMKLMGRELASEVETLISNELLRLAQDGETL